MMPATLTRPETMDDRRLAYTLAEVAGGQESCPHVPSEWQRALMVEAARRLTVRT